MGILAELDIAGPVPLVFNAPALPDQPQPCFWRCSQAGDEQVLPERSSLPLRVVVSAFTATIKALPGQFSLM